MGISGDSLNTNFRFVDQKQLQRKQLQHKQLKESSLNQKIKSENHSAKTENLDSVEKPPAMDGIEDAVIVRSQEQQEIINREWTAVGAVVS